MRGRSAEHYSVYFSPSIALCAALLMAACGTVAPRVPVPARAAPAAPAAAANHHAAPALPAAGSGRGGYYQDDGPGDNPPQNLLAVPDAEPVVEPVYPGASRPYVVFGKTYTPIGINAPLKQRGIGSWYGKKFNGQKTSSGERYDMYKMTAAHPTMPLPSYARVTNLSNGKQVIVRVNDRGPFHSSRIIDLSYTAALKLGYLGKGSTELEVERLLPEEIARMQKDRLGERAVALNAPSSTKSAPAPVVKTAGDTPDTAAIASAIAPPVGAAVSPTPTAPVPVAFDTLFRTDAARPSAGAVDGAASMQGSHLTLTDANGADAPRMGATNGAPSSGIYLQLGAFSQATNADAVRIRLERDSAALALPPLQLVEASGVFRLLSGPFSTRDEATARAQKIHEADGVKAFIVER